tara:strand:+ start:12 stop:176 length:165 start_codon:yes stop_codon:yes gene_type:complete
MKGENLLLKSRVKVLNVFLFLLLISIAGLGMHIIEQQKEIKALKSSKSSFEYLY